jgi:hypothetical protein
MLAVKIHQRKDDRTGEFEKTVKNISGYIRDKLRLTGFKFLSDDHCVEIISGQENPGGKDQIVAELVIRKTIVINKSDIDSKEELDKYIADIKHFCDQAKAIEEGKAYTPIHMR